MQQRSSVIFLLDSAPQNIWTSIREAEICLCRALTARGIVPIVALTGDYSEELRDRYKSVGALIVSMGVPSGLNYARYYREVGRLIREFKPKLVHIDHFAYFSSVPWIARFHGVHRIVYMESNSGML